MRFGALILFLLTNVPLLHTQDLAFKTDLRALMLDHSAIMQNDSVTSGVRRRRQPANMSWMEKALWEDDGVLRSTGLVPPLSPGERKSELAVRRTMLVAHQVGGFLTLGLMGSAVYFGQKIIDGNPGYRTNHQIFVTATIASYSATGLLAILSPPPVMRRDEVSTTSVHKTLAWIHAAGMILTPVLGASIQRNATSSQLAHFHQISAYITTATLAASLITVTF